MSAPVAPTRVKNSRRLMMFFGSGFPCGFSSSFGLLMVVFPCIGSFDFSLQILLHKLERCVRVLGIIHATNFALALINHAPFSKALRLENLRALHIRLWRHFSKAFAEIKICLPRGGGLFRWRDHEEK